MFSYMLLRSAVNKPPTYNFPGYFTFWIPSMGIYRKGQTGPIKITETCIECGKCAKACQYGAIIRNDANETIIDGNRCVTSCFHDVCQASCPVPDAIEFTG